MNQRLVLLSLLVCSRSLCGAPGYTAQILDPGTAGSALSGLAAGEQVGQFRIVGGPVHAGLWRSSVASLVDLHPAGYVTSYALATDGARQVGSAQSSDGANHAFLWSGDAASGVDLTPAGFTDAIAHGVSGEWQGGEVSALGAGVPSHAALWRGTAGSFVDLNPAGFRSSVVTDVSGLRQVGYGDAVPPPPPPGFPQTRAPEHAILWSGSATDYIDLNPAGFKGSAANAISGDRQVGQGDGHALLWRSTPESAVDLHPAGFTNSSAHAVSEGFEAGWAYDSSSASAGMHAALWQGSAESFVDLHQYLPVGFTTSIAAGVDSDGNVVGIAYLENQPYAVLWVVPEPSGAAGLAGIGIGLTARRRRRVG